MIEHLCTKQSIPLPNFAQENAFKMALFSCWQQSDIYILWTTGYENTSTCSQHKVHSLLIPHSPPVNIVCCFCRGKARESDRLLGYIHVVLSRLQEYIYVYQTLGRLPSFPSELWASFGVPENGSMLVMWGMVATEDLCREWFCFSLVLVGWASAPLTSGRVMNSFSLLSGLLAFIFSCTLSWRKLRSDWRGWGLRVVLWWLVMGVFLLRLGGGFLTILSLTLKRASMHALSLGRRNQYAGKFTKEYNIYLTDKIRNMIWL